ncbi:hypothetical protein AX15_006655 [Amanita polypyramis BW_CC]|nr:hypothetical protein AX15_006655 [Amanita polypyramis BW_CC]
MPHNYHLTPDQITIREQRKAKRLRQLEAQSSVTPDSELDIGLILKRPWISLVDEQENERDGFRVKILTFNSLAQCLVRRELFPTSQCLKATQREPMLHREILTYSPDIICLQEVDRLDKLVPVLEQAQYSYHYGAGVGKKHGCLIAYKRKMYAKLSDRLVDYDEEEIRAHGNERARQGRSFWTRNVGIVVTLKSTDDSGWGIIIATTHLFWHPKYTYERARQAGILVREIVKHRSDSGKTNWPCVIAGDFNFTPNDPAYSLIVGDPLLPEQEACITESRVVHISVDPTIPKTDKPSPDNDEEAIDPDRVITNARTATEADGLLCTAELQALYEGVQLRSVYDIGLRQAKAYSQNPCKTFGDRFPLFPGRRGSYEPEYTSYTHYWKAVLDYIFILEDKDSRCQILGLLEPHRSENMEPGLPKQGVCGSDHISLSGELFWKSI